MNPVVLDAFVEILEAHYEGGPALEIGPNRRGLALLDTPPLQEAEERIGVDLDHWEGATYKLVQGSAHDLSFLEDDRFELVLSHAVFEHDSRFWRSLAEMRRVLRPGGLMIVGVPAYTTTHQRTSLWQRVRGVLLTGKFGHSGSSTPTFGVHGLPGDYYRFSEQAMREVLLEGLEGTQVRELLNPPRLVGYGFLPGAQAPLDPTPPAHTVLRFSNPSKAPVGSSLSTVTSSTRARGGPS